MPIKIYLAGPDVFLQEARSVGQQKQDICRPFGFDAFFPFDVNETKKGDRHFIFLKNCEQMREADVGLFNLTPFRGPSADAGTVLELGFMLQQHQLGRCKLLCGYAAYPDDTQRLYSVRVAAQFGPVSPEDPPFDKNGYRIETFDGFVDNLIEAVPVV
jgi:nucleoside 2-deoxyribosyltransferase